MSGQQTADDRLAEMAGRATRRLDGCKVNLDRMAKDVRELVAAVRQARALLKDAGALDNLRDLFKTT